VAQEPRTSRGQQSRARIVEAAAGVIANVGVDAATCDQILAAAGASKSQMYHYFDGKEDLVRAVISLRFDQIIDAQMPWIAGLDTFAGIRAWFDMLIAINEAANSPGCALACLAAEIADRDEEARVMLAAKFERWEQYLVDGLETMQRRGELTEYASPRVLAAATFATLQGGLLQSKTRKDPHLLKLALDAAFEHLSARSSVAI
jgi:TetR/AcrR family transcriptional regulator, transcriptional repressor for nem operon